jgi:hypothetical protein
MNAARRVGAPTSPLCPVSGSRVRPEVEQLIREAIPFHLQGLAEGGPPIPDPASVEAETFAI